MTTLICVAFDKSVMINIYIGVSGIDFWGSKKRVSKKHWGILCIPVQA